MGGYVYQCQKVADGELEKVCLEELLLDHASQQVEGIRSEAFYVDVP